MSACTESLHLEFVCIIYIWMSAHNVILVYAELVRPELEGLHREIISILLVYSVYLSG